MSESKTKSTITSWDALFAKGWSVSPTKTDGIGQQLFRARRDAHDFSGTKPELLERISVIEDTEAELGGRHEAQVRERRQEEITQRVLVVRRLLAEWAKDCIEARDLSKQALDTDDPEVRQQLDQRSRQRYKDAPAKIARATSTLRSLTDFSKEERDANDGFVKTTAAVKKALIVAGS